MEEDHLKRVETELNIAEGSAVMPPIVVQLYREVARTRALIDIAFSLRLIAVHLDEWGEAK